MDGEILMRVVQVGLQNSNMTVRGVLLLVVLVVVCVAQQERPVVEVAQGRVVGLNTTRHNITFLEFLSIPYAQPPVDHLRFKDPVPAGPWDGDLDASSLPRPCDQLVVTGREDCLYLNVYTPEDALGTPEPLAVMVFIHGGAFYLGSARTYHGFEELLKRRVVVVMMQYRLGVLGFLSTEDEAAPGNQGLKDQALALTWIRDNIAAFGGDPNKVTLMGESAGAISIHYHLLIPSSADLFSGAIMESGTSLCNWGRGRDFRLAAQTLALNEALVSCLQTINDHVLDSEYLVLPPFYFAPRVDGVYIPDDPVTLLKEGRYHHVPTIMGINRDELSLQSLEMYTVPNMIDNLVANFSVNGPMSLQLYDDEDPINTANTVYDYYHLGDLNITKEDCDNLTRLYSDTVFLLSYDWSVQLMSDQTPVYAYEFHHRGEHSYLDSFFDNGLDLPQGQKYVCHGDELQYIVNPQHANLTTTDDLFLGNIIPTMWTNFAKTGNPTPDLSMGFVWEVSNPSSLQHLKILPQPVMEGDQRTDVRAFWETLPLRINNLLHG
ncbi:hypothetical protein Pmani_021392 [Petrolisthes manimaculis]|uniref:Carboxylic ester hydrolase n=1 Tax=Petrolisthes manimaculis TaxID=1843537 RepID=A0AAE1PFU5_9EUCA|nr:hypothetical protein Pmani_021392 [Petrolisthes manimaculis]